jgi:ApaG protein
MSEAVTQAIRVRATPRFHPERSDPTRQKWFFSYTIAIANEGPRRVQLLARHWRITDATGRVEEVRGPGVIGQTPVINPGEEFTYTSYCPLDTPLGAMEGSYRMRTEDGSEFDAQIATFVLEDPDQVN